MSKLSTRVRRRRAVCTSRAYVLSKGVNGRKGCKGRLRPSTLPTSKPRDGRLQGACTHGHACARRDAGARTRGGSSRGRPPSPSTRWATRSGPTPGSPPGCPTCQTAAYSGRPATAATWAGSELARPPAAGEGRPSACQCVWLSCCTPCQAMHRCMQLHEPEAGIFLCWSKVMVHGAVSAWTAPGGRSFSLCLLAALLKSVLWFGESW